MAYLDHNATSPLRPQAHAAMERALGLQANASSVHRAGRSARALIEEARAEVARLAGASAEQIVFTSCGSEANALALWGAVERTRESGPPVGYLCVSAMEHDSVLRTAAQIVDRIPGLRIVVIPVGRDGAVDIEWLRIFLDSADARTLVAVMAANNETGIIQPVGEVIDMVREADGLCLVDAVQSCGKFASDFAADYLTFSAHKLGGPQGAGALVIKEGAPFRAQLVGGGQETYRRAGTENVAGIAGFGAAAKVCRGDDLSRLSRLRDGFEAELRFRFPECVIFGEDVARLPNTSNFALPGLPAETALIALDLDGVMVSSGAACSSGKVRASHVLEAMSVRPEIARCALRVSLGWNSDEADMDVALVSLEKLAARMAARRAA
ncbi:MAG TPA: cysteine desulfurase family protein [Rhizomicrobium sp.]|jgi:cysteine desulfurase